MQGLKAQVRAAFAVNRELVLLYWHNGREIFRSSKSLAVARKWSSGFLKTCGVSFPM